ncbi:alpha/beta hydrolase fold domain-containing protein [Inquilinus sp. Marseille-Q2685]|uniref:alpha/beta hydrolase fold domain-containing protein n=1 Tax=Inquilinus sp. Marseille-Q2685 TaxID=2866581 RepID=UPI001CE3EF4D|nr:alpha/beta hydrolase fold domain-containing protein [Inquilinus sp. Marseille-Q2685]
MTGFDPNDAPNPEMAAIMARLAAEDGHLPDPTTLPPAEGRAQAEAGNVRWNRDLPPMETAELTLPGGAGPRAARLFRPASAHGAILYIHGGGWAFCSLDTHDRAMRCLAEATGMAVIGIDYRLAPEHPYPAGLDDAAAAWRALPEVLARHGIAGPAGVSGDSAGANLALALMLREQESGRMLPGFGLLFYGVYAVDHDTESHRRFGPGGYGLTTAKMIRYRDWYAPDPASWGEPPVSPLTASNAALRTLPPLYLNAAGLDPLLSDTLMLGERLRALGRADPVRVHRGVIHGFMQMTTALAEARTAFAEAGAWARRFNENA